MRDSLLACRIREALAPYGKLPSARAEGPSQKVVEAAMAGNAQAQYRLARLYMEGANGIARDSATAVMWFNAAADGGHLPAMLQLGEAYLLGHGIARNRVLGFLWLAKAARAGNSDAAHRLATGFLLGHLLPRNARAAVKWLRVAVRLGNNRALPYLGRCYLNGTGVEANRVKGYAILMAWLLRTGEDPRRMDGAMKSAGLTDSETDVARDASRLMVLKSWSF